jgi:hypothetical protein
LSPVSDKALDRRETKPPKIDATDLAISPLPARKKFLVLV